MFKEKEKIVKLIILLVSVILVLCIPFIFDMKVVDSENIEYRGFPIDWLAIYHNDGYKNGYSFKGFGFLLDVVLFYLFIKFVVNRFKKNREKK